MFLVQDDCDRGAFIAILLHVCDPGNSLVLVYTVANQGDEFKHQRHGCHRGDFRSRILCRDHADDVGANDVHAPEPMKYLFAFPGAQAALHRLHI
jgi:hypothetical protein